MSDSLPWYDSGWLAKFFAARRVIAKVAPAKLDGFVNAFAPLRTDPNFAVRPLPQLFGAEELEEMRAQVRALDPKLLEMGEAKRFGRFVAHNLPYFTQMQRNLTDRVSEWAGEELEPSYNFLCLYTRMGVCEPHLDSPLAKWTLDICLDQSVPWPIHFSQIVPWPEENAYPGEGWQDAIKTDPALRFTAQVLTPGDAVLFSGSSQWHFRDPLAASGSKPFCDLLFLHYIPKGADRIVRPAEWAEMFGVPELAAIPRIDEAW